MNSSSFSLSGSVRSRGFLLRRVKSMSMFAMVGERDWCLMPAEGLFVIVV